MKKIIILIIFAFILVGCNTPSEATEPTNQLIKLDTPVITIDQEGNASFEVENASAYLYILNNGSETLTANSTLKLNVGDTLKVLAIGDVKTYANSDYSLEVTYTISTNPSGSVEFPWI